MKALYDAAAFLGVEITNVEHCCPSDKSHVTFMVNGNRGYYWIKAGEERGIRIEMAGMCIENAIGITARLSIMTNSTQLSPLP